MNRVDNLVRCVPPGMKVPELLLEAARWMDDFAGQVPRDFDFAGERMGADWLAVNGSDLFERFIPFIQLPRGSRVGFWRTNENALEDCPVFHFYSEGDDSVIAKSLNDFLHKLASGSTTISELDADATTEAVTSRAQLKARLLPKLQSSNEVGTSDADTAGLTERVRAELQAWNTRQQQEFNSNRVAKSIYAKLKHYTAVNAQPWERANFEIVMVGKHFQLTRKFFGDQLIEEAAEVEPLLRELRNQRAMQVPDRGVWHTAWLSLGPEGSVSLDCDFLSDPHNLFKDAAPPASEYASDFAAYKRSQYWKPDWATERTSPNMVTT